MPIGIYERKRLPATERFWAKVEKNGSNGCWLWTSAISRGYGTFWLDSKPVYAHRFAYEQLIGSIPEDTEIDHLCRNRVCVNPEHMELVTTRQNILRGEGHTALNARKTHCLRGHQFDLFNTHYRSDRSGRECQICKRIHNAKRKTG